MELEATASLFSHSNFFSIDDLLEFSNDDIGGSIPDTDTPLKYSFLDTVHDYTKYSPVTEADSEILQFSTLGNEEIGLEWLSDLAEETCGGGANSSSTATVNEKERLQESNTAPDNKQQPASLTMAVPCRARTKRSRVHVWPAKTESSNMQTQGDTWWDWEIPYNEGFNTDTTPSEEVGECLKKVKKSKRKGRESGGQPRRCTHCQTQKTPQWRQGPLGPKSLCNACGVRFKSGRLYPEYRPAKSPTFVSYRHSNSHKKVLEMRGTYQYQYHQQHHQQGQLRLPASASASSTATE